MQASSLGQGSRLLVSTLLLFLLLPSFAAPRAATAYEGQGQSARAPQQALPPVPTYVIEGHVLTPAGAPAAGAVVVSSAGGKAVTDADGRYAFEVELAAGTAALQVTAARSGGSGNLIASTAAPVQAGVRRIGPGRLQLASSTACEPSWLPKFGPKPGLTGFTYGPEVLSMAVFDDGSGSGPELYVGGNLETAGTELVPGIAKWNGFSWSAVGVQSDTDWFLSLVVHDDGAGGGPALYAASSSSVRRWDGSAWSTVAVMNGNVWALASFDDGAGGGAALYAGGWFNNAGGASANFIAKWDGTTWSSVGTGVNAQVRVLEVFDDGGGPALYAGGDFWLAGGMSANRIARWDGSSWSSLGSGTGGTVYALESYSGNGTPGLYAGGSFSTAGTVSASNIARWDGTSWSAVGGGTNATVRALKVYDDGSGAGPALYVGASHLLKWDGVTWTSTGVSYASALEVFDDGLGSGPRLIMGGTEVLPNGMSSGGIAQFDGSEWFVLGGGVNDMVRALAVFDDGAGGGPMLYAAGRFMIAGGTHARRIARWDGNSWSPLGSGITGGIGGPGVNVLAVHDDGSGQALYAGGFFTAAGGVPANNIARWNGTAWSALGTGTSNTVSALISHDDGSGSALYLGGSFTSAGGVPADRVAKWRGTTFSPLGLGMNNTVRSFESFDDGQGAGPQLYAGGDFSSAGGAPADRIARWDGASWSAVAGGVSGGFASSVYVLTVHDDGAGPALYAGGLFSSPGANTARWNGVSWEPLGGGLATAVYALVPYDDGQGAGPLLYAAGALSKIFAWDGVTWAPLTGGLQPPSASSSTVAFALTVHDDGSGSGDTLIVAGNFSFADSSYIVAWGGCADDGVGVTFCAGDGSASPCPCGNSGGSGEGCANSTGPGAAIAGAGSASVGADDLVVSSTQLPHAKWVTLFAGDLAVNGGLGLTFGGGLRCAGGNVVRLGVEYTGTSGSVAFGPGLLGPTGYGAGQTAHFQVWYRDTAAASCGTGFNASSGLAVALEP